MKRLLLCTAAALINAHAYAQSVNAPGIPRSAIGSTVAPLSGGVVPPANLPPAGAVTLGAVMPGPNMLIQSNGALTPATGSTAVGHWSDMDYGAMRDGSSHPIGQAISANRIGVKLNGGTPITSLAALQAAYPFTSTYAAALGLAFPLTGFAPPEVSTFGYTAAGTTLNISTLATSAYPVVPGMVLAAGSASYSTTLSSAVTVGGGNTLQIASATNVVVGEVIGLTGYSAEKIFVGSVNGTAITVVDALGNAVNPSGAVASGSAVTFTSTVGTAPLITSLTAAVTAGGANSITVGSTSGVFVGESVYLPSYSTTPFYVGSITGGVVTLVDQNGNAVPPAASFAVGAPVIFAASFGISPIYVTAVSAGGAAGTTATLSAPLQIASATTTTSKVSASFVGSIAGTALTVISGGSGIAQASEALTGAAVTPGTFITACASATSCTVNISQTVAAESMTAAGFTPTGTNAVQFQQFIPAPYVGQTITCPAIPGFGSVTVSAGISTTSGADTSASAMPIITVPVVPTGSTGPIPVSLPPNAACTAAITDALVANIETDWLARETALYAMGTSASGGEFLAGSGQATLNNSAFVGLETVVPITLAYHSPFQAPQLNVTADRQSSWDYYAYDMGYNRFAWRPDSMAAVNAGQHDYTWTGISVRTNANFVFNAPLFGMSGILIGNGAIIDRPQLYNGLFAGIYIAGNHTTVRQPTAIRDYYGVYWGYNGGNFGDFYFDWSNTQGEGRASLGDAWNNTISHLTAIYGTWGQEPYFAYREQETPLAIAEGISLNSYNFISDSLLLGIYTEGVSAAIYGANSATGTGNDNVTLTTCVACNFTGTGISLSPSSTTLSQPVLAGQTSITIASTTGVQINELVTGLSAAFGAGPLYAGTPVGNVVPIVTANGASVTATSGLAVNSAVSFTAPVQDAKAPLNYQFVVGDFASNNWSGTLGIFDSQDYPTHTGAFYVSNGFTNNDLGNNSCGVVEGVTLNGVTYPNGSNQIIYPAGGSVGNNKWSCGNQVQGDIVNINPASAIQVGQILSLYRYNTLLPMAAGLPPYGVATVADAVTGANFSMPVVIKGQVNILKNSTATIAQGAAVCLDATASYSQVTSCPTSGPAIPVGTALVPAAAGTTTVNVFFQPPSIAPGSSPQEYGPASAVSGNLPSFADNTGKSLQDSGVSATNVAHNASPTVVTGHAVIYDSLGRLADSGSPPGTGTTSGPAITTPGDIVTWNSNNGTLMGDGGASSNSPQFYMPSMVAGSWYAPYNAVPSSMTPVANVLYLLPIPVREAAGATIALQNMGFHATTAATAATAVEMCLFKDPGTGKPDGGALVPGATAAITTTLTAADQSAAVASPPALVAGLYWLGIDFGAVNGIAASSTSNSTSDYILNQQIGASSVGAAVGSAGGSTGRYATGVTEGTCPATVPTTALAPNTGIPMGALGF